MTKKVHILWGYSTLCDKDPVRCVTKLPGDFVRWINSGLVEANVCSDCLVTSINAGQIKVLSQLEPK